MGRMICGPLGLRALFIVGVSACATEDVTKPVGVVPAEPTRARVESGPRGQSATVTDLGGGAGSVAYDINATGRAVGEAGTAPNRAALFLPLTQLSSGSGSPQGISGISTQAWLAGWGTLTSGTAAAFVVGPSGQVVWLAASPSLTVGSASDLNDGGHVVGFVRNVAASVSHVAYWNSATSVIDLGTLGGTEGVALAINNSERIVGYSTNAVGKRWAFAMNGAGGTMTALAELAGSTENLAEDVSDGGVIVGQSGGRAVLWPTVGIVDLGAGCESLAGIGTSSVGAGVYGSLAGFITVVGICGRRAMAWFGTLAGGFVAEYLDALPGDTEGTARKVNAALQAVGESHDPGAGVSRAVRWQLTFPNLPPYFATQPSAQSGSEGGALTFGASATDPEGASLTYDWDFGDGSAHGSGSAPTHSYADNGSYAVIVTASDGSTVRTASTTATVSNVAPTATLQVPGVGVEAGTTFAIAIIDAIDPSTADVAAGFQYAFDCEGDGTFSVPSATPDVICTAGAVGAASVMGRILDKDAGSTTYSGSVTIIPFNEPPVLTLGGPWNGAEGSTVSFTATGNDPEGAPLLYRWDFGDSSAIGSGATSSHSYADNGVYTVVVTLSDGAKVSTASSTATIVNVAPTATFQVPGVPVSVGTPFAIALSAPVEPSSADSAAGVMYAFDCENDGSFTAPSATPNTTCTLTTAGTRVVAGRVSDKDGGVTTYTGSVVVIVPNLPPVVSPGGPYTGAATQLITFSGTATDPEGTSVTYQWAFGDGATSTSLPVKHAYPASGSYTATLTATDAGGVSGSATVVVTVGAPPSSFPILEAGCFHQTTGIAFDGTYYYVGEGHNSLFQCVTRYTATGAFVDTKVFASDIRGLHFVPATGKMVSRTWGGALYQHDYAAGTLLRISPNGITGGGLEQSQPAADPDGSSYWILHPTAGPGGTPRAEHRSIATTALIAAFPVTTSQPATEPMIAVSNYRVYTLNGASLNIYNKTSGILLGTQALTSAICGYYGFGVSASGDRAMYAALKNGYCAGARVDLIPAVTNALPVAAIATPILANEGASVTVDASGSSDADQDLLTYSWTFGDGASGTGVSPSHAYADDRSYTVTVTVSDGYSSSIATTTATIANVAPTATFQLPGVDVIAGAQFAIALSGASDASSADVAAGFTYAFDCDGSGTFVPTGNTPNITCTSGTPGVYAAAGQLTDKDGATTTYTGAVTVIAAVNLPPAISFGGPFAAAEGSPTAFNATAIDPEGQPIAYSWDFGDGSPAATGNAPSHSYADNGSYTVTLTVSDGVNVITGNAVATIANVVPTATFQVPGVTITAGAPFAIAMIGATDPSSTDVAAGFSYTFDCEGDGTFTAPSTTPNVTCILSSAGTYTTWGRVHDKDGGQSSYNGTVTVVAAVNLPPTVSIGGPYTGAEGAVVALGATANDPEGQPITYAWNFGDGSPAGSGATPTHAFPDNGSYTVSVTVSDGVNSATATTTASITNVAPTGAIVAPAGSSAPQGFVALTLGNVAEPSPVDAATLQYRFNCGAGFGPFGPAPTTICTIPKVGNVTVRITVRDKDGAQNTYVKTISMTNVAPTVTLLSPSSVTVPRGTSVSFSARFTDPGTSDNPWAARVRWGGGLGAQALGNKTPGVPFGASKVYPTPGVFAASVEVSDKYGAKHQQTFTVTVQ